MLKRPVRWALFTSAAVLAVGATALGLPATDSADAVSPSAAPRGASAAQTVLYVSPTGSDRNPGTAQAPLRTPQLAVDRSLRGGIVELTDGTYAKQRMLIVGATDLTVRAAPRATPVLDETGLTPMDGDGGVVEIRDGARITVSGLTITGYRTRSMAKVPIGIYVTGAAKNVTLSGNHVHHLGNDNPTRGSFDINAHGIAVYGRNATSSISGLTVTDNEIDHLVLGASEAVVVNGNVDGWAVTGNNVHDNNNIGIDAIGYEDTIPGTARYTDANRARNGVIADNTVTNIISKGNPSYFEDGVWCNCADGIYVDGGRSIRIENNTVTRADIGIEVAAENPKGRTNDVRVTGNTVTGSGYVGLAVGGYGPRRGEAFEVTVRDNTFRGNNTLNDGSPEVLLQYKVHETTITGNSITATNRDNPVLVQRLKAAGTPAQNAGVRLDCNDYSVPGPTGDASFVWLGTPQVGLAAWRQASGQDAHSTVTRR